MINERMAPMLEVLLYSPASYVS